MKLVAKYSALVTLVASLAFAANNWMEPYSSLGSASDRESACTQAESQTRVLSLTACLGRRGVRSDEQFSCSCSTMKLGDSETFMCTGTLKVYCSK